MASITSPWELNRGPWICFYFTSPDRDVSMQGTAGFTEVPPGTQLRASISCLIAPTQVTFLLSPVDHVTCLFKNLLTVHGTHSELLNLAFEALWSMAPISYYFPMCIPNTQKNSSWSKEPYIFKSRGFNYALCQQFPSWLLQLENSTYLSRFNSDFTSSVHQNDRLC